MRFRRRLRCCSWCTGPSATDCAPWPTGSIGAASHASAWCPRARLEASLPEPRLSGNQSGPIRLLVEQGDRFQAELAGALSARFDELGWRTRRIEVAQDRMAATVLGNGWDVRIVQVPPPGQSPRDLLASTWLAIGEPDKAQAVVAGEPLDRHAASLPAVVLGHRNQDAASPSAAIGRGSRRRGTIALRRHVLSTRKQ